MSYKFAYLAEAVAIAKSMPRARFDGAAKSWSWTVDSVDQIDGLIDRLNQIYALALAAQQAAEREKNERQAARKIERAEREAAADQRRSQRYIVLAEAAPRVGQTLRRNGAAITIDSLGTQWRADDSLSSMGGPVGCDGEWVRYAYYRPATPTETAELEQAEAEATARRESAERRAAAIRVVREGEYAPATGAIPEGETIFEDAKHALIGAWTRIVLTPDNWLYYVSYDGSDGAAWGDYNLGRNTQGWRVAATPELISAIRGVTK